MLSRIIYTLQINLIKYYSVVSFIKGKSSMKKLLLAFTFFVLTFSVNATTFYVATTGNDSNPGTIGSPFATIGKLNTVMAAGDIAYIRGGTYQSAAGNGASVHFNITGLTGSSGFCFSSSGKSSPA